MADDARLDDYLNDKLQNVADFEAFDSLIAAVQTQQSLLQQQLQDAQHDLANAQRASAEQNAALEQHARAFQAQQQNIDRRLRIVTQSDTPDNAVQQFQGSMDMLNRLDMATLYLELVAEVDKLSNPAVSEFKTSPNDALNTYRALWDLSSRLQFLQTEAEGAAPHLIDYVEKTKWGVRENIRAGFAQDLNKVLTKILWPKPQMTMPASLETEWDVAVARLLELQKPELESRLHHNTKSHKYQEPLVLLPLEVMIRPLEVRFRYHFSGDKTTNRLDKPEYFLSHVLELLKSHETFVDDYLQPVLLNHFKGSLAQDLAYIDGTSALITALLPMVRTKVLQLVPQVSGQPQLLSHLVHELMGFDTTLRNEWRYTGSSSSAGTVWKGLAWEVLVQKDWFGRWLQVEKDFALARYQAIIETADSNNLDYDSVASSTTKPTKGAIRVNDLLETITERYRPLSSFSQKLSFLIDIQISIFDRFHSRLHSSLEAYLTMTSTLGRTVQGISAADLASIQGVAGLDRLCRVFGSADYLERKMADWSDDVFFLDLWTELQSRARANPASTSSRPTSASGDRNPSLLAGPMDLAHVASRTSSTLASRVMDDDVEETTGALFDETAGAYARLRVRSETVIIDTIIGRLRDALRPYSRNNPWSTLNSTDVIATEPSVDLQATLSVLDESFSFLAEALGPLPLRRITKVVAKMLDTYIFDRVMMVHLFAVHGAQQVNADVHALAAILEVKVGEGAGRSGLRKSLEAAQLLGLKVKGSSNADGEGTAWGGEDTDDEDTNAADGVELGLWQVERRLFESNESARDVLEEMGLLLLADQPQEARQVLRRRIELAA